MTKEQLLEFLKSKRNATAGVAAVQQALKVDQEKLERAKKMFHKTIITFAVFTLYFAS